MLSLFKKKQSSQTTPTLFLQQSCCPSISFDKFVKGIDNVHIDVYLSPYFIKLGNQLIYEFVKERSTTKRRFSDKPSKNIIQQLDAFNTSYASMLSEAIYRAKEGKRIDSIQLFQLAVIKFVLDTVRAKINQLLHEYRSATLNENHQKLKLSEHITWIKRNQDNLLYHVNYELFAQMLWVEKSTVGKLRESLLGIAWTIPEKMLSNPILQSPNPHNHEILMKHYVLLSQDIDSCYGFNRLNILIDQLLDEISSICPVQIAPPEKNHTDKNQFRDKENLININFSWKDNPINIDVLFNLQKTQQTLEEAEFPEQQTLIKTQLKIQRKTNKVLEQHLRQAQVILHLLAAYETPRLYKYYATLLKPYLLYQALCNEVDDSDIAVKLQNQLKIRQLRSSDSKSISINELKNTKKRLTKLVRKPGNEILRRFITDFVTYRRDLKSYHLMQKTMKQIHLLSDQADVQLSRSNNTLHEFFSPEEYTKTEESIRCHVIVKADLRGSTTMTDELRRRELNPATHFSRNFFNPIRQLIKIFGAEKVFIEGDAVILSLFEYQNSPEQWLATARACGLAQNMLTVVDKQNEVSRTHNLPELELGIGICYSPEAPKFLYDGDQRIMISPAIGIADRLSSCSWKLRRKYSEQSNLLTHVMVFQQPPDDAFKGEKGMTTFRYNLNGIELDTPAFKKLKNEVALRQIKINLPGDEYSTYFYAGYYPDVEGERQKVVIREGRVKIWQENTNDYPLTDILFYEVVTNKKILYTINKRGF
ncbi:hypothetical protein [Candidatus Parabeggiatoa sp. HSG14]|uniref:hypothetical protein n=1 Tax=Candidatus Parabeggiatoa sp. HSG14 TaxID=3055593 RepID=UPI0025A7CACF|nr:hypothetical protein [Thiotrichales bacterium HSG14]